MNISSPMIKKSHLLFIFFLFSILGSLLYSHEWNSEFHWDDYHLIRPYSNQELIQVWSGSWDPDYVETPGFRPLTTYFNHFRYMLFGEYVYAHRLFLIFLNALMSVLFVLLMVELSFPWLEGFLGGLLYLVSPLNFYHIAWLTDGIHLFAAILGFLGIFFALKAAHKENFHWYFILSHFFGLAALLSRPENVSLYLISLMAPFFFTQIKKPLREYIKSPLFCHAVAGFVFIGVFLIYRKMVIPESISPFAGMGVIPAFANNFFKLLLASVNLLALIKNSHLIMSVLILAGITGYGIFLGRKGNLKGLLFLFFSLIICLLPISLFYRTNLLLNPTLFAMGIFSFSLVKIFRHMPRIIKTIGIVAFVFVLGIMARENYLYQENLHPSSLLHLSRKGEMLFYWETATIPQMRREKALSELKALGLIANSNITWDQFSQTIWHNVMHSSHRRPHKGKLFKPLRDNFYL